jgi:hypothetical protein
MRKLLFAVGVLVIAGVLPAVASLRACGPQACCRSFQVATPSFTARGCCSPATCAAAPPSESTRTTTESHLDFAPIEVIAPVLIAPLWPPRVPQRIAIAPGSPPIQQRLAALSILLI